MKGKEGVGIDGACFGALLVDVRAVKIPLDLSCITTYKSYKHDVCLI